MNIVELLNRAKSARDIPSDLQLAERMNLTHTTIGKWRKGESLPNIEHAQQLAELAGLDPAKVVAEVLIEGAKSPALVKTLRRFLAVAVTGIICILCQMFEHPSRGSHRKALYNSAS